MNKNFYQEMLEKHGVDDFIAIFIETIKNHRYGENLNVYDKKRKSLNGEWIGGSESGFFDIIYNDLSKRAIYDCLLGDFRPDKRYWFFVKSDTLGNGYIYSANSILDGVEYYYEEVHPDVVKAIEKALKEK